MYIDLVSANVEKHFILYKKSLNPKFTSHRNLADFFSVKPAQKTVVDVRLADKVVVRWHGSVVIGQGSRPAEEKSILYSSSTRNVRSGTVVPWQGITVTGQGSRPERGKFDKSGLEDNLHGTAVFGQGFEACGIIIFNSTPAQSEA